MDERKVDSEGHKIPEGHDKTVKKVVKLWKCYSLVWESTTYPFPTVFHHDENTKGLLLRSLLEESQRLKWWKKRKPWMTIISFAVSRYLKTSLSQHSTYTTSWSKIHKLKAPGPQGSLFTYIGEADKKYIKWMGHPELDCSLKIHSPKCLNGSGASGRSRVLKAQRLRNRSFSIAWVLLNINVRSLQKHSEDLETLVPQNSPMYTHFICNMVRK